MERQCIHLLVVLTVLWKALASHLVLECAEGKLTALPIITSDYRHCIIEYTTRQTIKKYDLYTLHAHHRGMPWLLEETKWLHI